MSLTHPDRLELSYVRAMLAGLLLSGDPEKVLILGLGGGSLAKFLLENFPGCRIDAVEFRPEVVAVARRFFGLPEDPRLAIHVADAGEFVRSAPANRVSGYGYIFLDLYDPEGLAGVAAQPDFIAASAKLLEGCGILAMNLWGSREKSYRHSLQLLRECFGQAILQLPVIGRGNVIAFGRGAEGFAPRRRALVPRARLLEQRLDIEFTRFLQRFTPMEN